MTFKNDRQRKAVMRQVKRKHGLAGIVEKAMDIKLPEKEYQDRIAVLRKQIARDKMFIKRGQAESSGVYDKMKAGMGRTWLKRDQYALDRLLHEKREGISFD